MTLELRADCERCVGLCCVALPFARSTDFAIDKAAGEPCPHLNDDFRCGIHQRLRQGGFPGCAAYDCFGAGQQVTQVTFGGRDWRRTPEIADQMFSTFRVMRQLHELLWYLSAALQLPDASPVHDDLRAAVNETERLTGETPEALLALDMAAYRDDVNALLTRASALARGGSGRQADHRGADLAGKDLRKIDLRGANLRGALLIGATLAGADLSLADLTGADLRGADLRGADLSQSLFVTQPQLEAARGDSRTKVPSQLGRPAHWPMTEGELARL